jgi:hypothetical protein
MKKQQIADFILLISQSKKVESTFEVPATFHLAKQKKYESLINIY